MLQVRHLRLRRGILHFEVHGKGSKIRFVPVHPRAAVLIEEYLEATGLLASDGTERDPAEAAPQLGHLGSLKLKDTPLFRPVRNNATHDLDKPLSPDAVYQNVVLHYARELHPCHSLTRGGQRERA